MRLNILKVGGSWVEIIKKEVQQFSSGGEGRSISPKIRRGGERDGKT